MAAAEKSCTKLGVQIQHELEVCFISTLKAEFVEADLHCPYIGTLRQDI